jgi:hypothetical protein
MCPRNDESAGKRSGRIMDFHANYVSTSVFGDGDYYQALFPIRLRQTCTTYRVAAPIPLRQHCAMTGRLGLAERLVVHQYVVGVCLNRIGMFQAEQDADDPDSPYLLIQRQFEDQEDNLCYIETHDEKYCGHFLLRHLDFTPQKLSIELDRPRNNLVSVTFAMAAAEFAEASQVVKIISGEIEPL